jgi:hypothetical protein
VEGTADLDEETSIMIFAFLTAEPVVAEAVSGLPKAISLGVGVFLSFALLIFIVTRLNQDR